METNSTKNHQNHAIILSLPLQGHVNPAVHLALKLASSRGFTITFLIFEYLHHQITQARAQPTNRSEPDDIFKWARAGPNGLDIRYKVMSDGLPVEFDRTGELDEYLDWFLNGGMHGQVEEAVGEIVSRSQPPVTVLIVDTFYPWASKVANKFGLPYASFWTEPALVFSLYYHVHLLQEHGHFPNVGSRKDPVDYIPGVKSIETKDLMSYLQDSDISTNMHKLLFRALQDVRSANYVLCNTVQDLEPTTISALQSIMPFYPIGPLILNGSTKNIVPTSLWVESNCSEWLSSKPNSSILYVSFGSLASFTKSEVMEIAYGLMLSNVEFVWVLRPRTVLHEVDGLLPLGFEEEIRGRGIIVPWTDQIAVLSHPSVGGFLTHCGWNSVLESVWCGTPMLCFPVFTDQFTNRKLVVDDWKIGVNLCDEKALQRLMLATQIKNFMSQDSRDELKKNISDVKRVLEDAMGVNGSLDKNIDLFIEKLNK